MNECMSMGEANEACYFTRAERDALLKVECLLSPLRSLSSQCCDQHSRGA
jgi:hypothetical protein